MIHVPLNNTQELTKLFSNIIYENNNKKHSVFLTSYMCLHHISEITANGHDIYKLEILMLSKKVSIDTNNKYNSWKTLQKLCYALTSPIINVYALNMLNYF